jgi:hypothetical protein
MGTWLERTARLYGGGDALHRFAEALLAALPDPAWRDLVERHGGDERAPDDVSFVLHPAEEPLRLSLDADVLRAEARTNSAGPGYHAFVTELLDAAAEACGLDWDPQEDATSYVATRDFPALQREACAWLRAVGKKLSEMAREGYASLNVSMGIVVVDEPRIASPLGFWPATWFDETARAEGDALDRRGAEFFPWYRRGLDADAWARAGLAIAWSELPWRAPRDREEERRYRQAVLCFSRARALDANVALPANVDEEVRALLDARGQPLKAPAPDGIGFRRRVLRWPLPGGWTLEAPGYFLSTVEREGDTKVLYFPGRTVRVSTLTFEHRPSAKAILERHPQPEDPLRFTRGHLEGLASLVAEQDGEQRSWVLQGAVAAPGELCLVTVSFADPKDRDWAIGVWSSAFHVGAEAE